MKILLALIVLFIVSFLILFSPAIFSRKIIFTQSHIFKMPIFIKVIFSNKLWKQILDLFYSEYKIEKNQSVLTTPKFELKKLFILEENKFKWSKTRKTKDSALERIYLFMTKSFFHYSAIWSLTILLFSVITYSYLGNFLNNDINKKDSSLKDRATLSRLILKTRDEPKNAKAWSSLGEKYYQKGNLEKSISFYKKSIKLDNKSPKTHSLLAQALIKVNNGKITAQVKRHIQSALRLGEFEPLAIYYSAVARLEAEDYNLAVGIFKYLIEETSSNDILNRKSQSKIKMIEEYTGFNPDNIDPINPAVAAKGFRM
jgi:cytochrome c-type biogenesis protein CcmH/NrfG